MSVFSIKSLMDKISRSKTEEVKRSKKMNYLFKGEIMQYMKENSCIYDLEFDREDNDTAIFKVNISYQLSLILNDLKFLDKIKEVSIKAGYKNMRFER